jgi:hypothetical protein
MQEQIQHQLDGHVVTALMAALSLRQILPTSTSDSIDLAGIAGDRESLRTAFEILGCLGWAKVIEPRVEVTPRGRLAMACAKQYWYPMGYLETLINVPQLLFGDPSVTIARTSNGEESHVDRRLDIRFSGSVFSKTCREPFLEIALPIFDQQPLETQPAALVDTGCGDGTLLRVLFENIRDRTLRGRRLADHPLAVIGVEPNRVAREVASENLTAAAIPHQVIEGDIAEPEKLAEKLRSIGTDPFNALQVCKSVIHNRPYRAPDNLHAAMRRRVRSAGAFTARDGSVIANALLEQNLVEHFRRWRPLAQRHGLLVVEAHTVDPAVTSKLIGSTIATAVDATHAYSNQDLVEPEVFMAAAREAGFISRTHRELGQSSVGHTVLTVDHFVANDERR